MSWVSKALTAVLVVSFTTAVDGVNACFASKCAAGTTRMSFSYCSITDADADDLAACFDTAGRSGIESVVLSFNLLTQVPSDLFTGMTNVEHVYFSNNDITSFDAATFLPMAPTLRRMGLGRNELTTFPLGMFAGMDRLETIWLSNNPVTTLPTGLFDDLTSLIYLEMKELDDPTLPSGLFANMGSLEYLTLQDSTLTSLVVGVFDGLTSLDYLDLRDNSLTTLPEGVFEDFGSGTSLQFLLLHGNEDLQCIPTHYATGDGTSQTYYASSTFTNDVDNDGLCECTDVATCDDGLTCSAGTEGYTCDDERVIVEAGEVTTVTVDATSFYARKWGTGCWPSGCIPENTRDGKKKASSRWSCEGTGCCITYHFNQPQDIVKVRIAFHNGNKGGILGLGVYEDGDYHSQFMSSGTTLGYQRHPLNTDNTQEIKLCLEDYSANTSGWLDITEVKFMVKD